MLRARALLGALALALALTAAAPAAAPLGAKGAAVRLNRLDPADRQDLRVRRFWSALEVLNYHQAVRMAVAVDRARYVRRHLAEGARSGPGRYAAPAPAGRTRWDRLAACESGGRWGIDTGNGFDGGLQFTHETWLAYGGGEFAPYAHLATREQQIVVAERVLAGQGPAAWPVCSYRAGMR